MGGRVEGCSVGGAEEWPGGGVGWSGGAVEGWRCGGVKL